MTVREYFDLRPQPNEVGIEIEMEGSLLPAALPKDLGWKATEDGSLRGEALEYVTRGAVKREDVGATLSNLQKWLQTSGSTLNPSDRCGVHIHINCQELTIPQWYNFAALYLVLEEVLVHFCGEEREGNLFCLRASDAEALITAIRKTRERGLHYELCTDNFRYASINFCATQKYGSLEFRAMRTTVDFSEIETWTNILLRVKDQSLHFIEMREIVEGLSAQGVDNFLRTVLGSYYELLQCPGMQRMVMRGVRRVQEIAYAPVSFTVPVHHENAVRRLEDFLVVPPAVAVFDDLPVPEIDDDDDDDLYDLEVEVEQDDEEF